MIGQAAYTAMLSLMGRGGTYPGEINVFATLSHRKRKAFTLVRSTGFSCKSRSI